MKEEVWKVVPNYQGRYKISNLGRLKSIINGKSKILKGSINKKGYVQFSLSYRAKKLYNVYGGHQLVAMAFLNHEPEGTNGFVVDHKNDIRTDNNLSNLQLISNYENCIKRNLNRPLFGAHKINDKYKSSVYHNKKMIYLGYYETELEAHKVAVDYVNENNLQRIIISKKKSDKKCKLRN